MQMTLSKGSFFGEDALLHPGKIQNTEAFALTTCILYVLSGENFKTVIDVYPEYRYVLEVRCVRCGAASTATVL
jgi:CRP-like cAMP-binding protein